jgi:hypothetical protein
VPAGLAYCFVLTCLRSRLISPSRQAFRTAFGISSRPQHSTGRAHFHDLVLIGRALPLTEGNPFQYTDPAGLLVSCGSFIPSVGGRLLGHPLRPPSLTLGSEHLAIGRKFRLQDRLRK